jgi:hypothetical protein
LTITGFDPNRTLADCKKLSRESWRQVVYSN